MPKEKDLDIYIPQNVVEKCVYNFGEQKGFNQCLDEISAKEFSPVDFVRFDAFQISLIVDHCMQNHSCCPSCIEDTEHGATDITACCCKFGQEVADAIIANKTKILKEVTC